MDLTPEPRSCVRCGSTDGPFARSSRSGFKHTVCASSTRCRERRELAEKLKTIRDEAYQAGREDAARDLEAEADDEAKRPGRNCCSHKIEGWLRAAAEIARSGSHPASAEPAPCQVWAVMFSNYEPAEIDSLHADRADAEARAREKGEGWAAVRMAISLGRSAGGVGDNPEEPAECESCGRTARYCKCEQDDSP